jgi:hypothetical protein
MESFVLKSFIEGVNVEPKLDGIERLSYKIGNVHNSRYLYDIAVIKKRNLVVDLTGQVRGSFQVYDLPQFAYISKSQEVILIITSCYSSINHSYKYLLKVSSFPIY